MNGAVFQTSAMIITISASGSCPSQTVSSGNPTAPSNVFVNPSSGSKIVCHVIAVTTVSTAHGTSMTVRRMPWPLNAACMAMAIATPSTSSRPTEKNVKTNVVRVASQNCRRSRPTARRCSCRRAVGSAQRTTPALSSEYWCSESQTA